MRHAKPWFLAGAALAAAVAACSAVQSSDFAAGSNNPSDAPKKSGDLADGGANAAGTSVALPGRPTANGVMILHSASFPSFRLCFEKLPNMLPQPDATVMPEANVVGVEIGSVVRIDPITTAPGKVYVIREPVLRNRPANETCGSLIRPGGLSINLDYNIATTTIDQPLGVGQVNVLAITGCGGAGFLEDLDGVDSNPNTASCGAPYNATAGNLKASVATLEPTFDKPTASQIPVQLFDMSAATDALGGHLAVTFGALGKAGNKALSIGALFAGGSQEKLDVDQSDAGSEAVYAQQGFQLSATLPSETVNASQSLADVQQLSAPDEVPTTYYRAASNYALLVVGDPSHKPTLAGGGDNPVYNPRRALHLLAVPVLDPSQLADAGASDAATSSPNP